PEDEPVDEDGDERDGHDAGDQPEGHADPAHRLGPAARPLPASAHDGAAPFRLPCFQDDTHLAVRGARARQNGPTIERSSSTERRRAGAARPYDRMVMEWEDSAHGTGV